MSILGELTASSECLRHLFCLREGGDHSLHLGQSGDDACGGSQRLHDYTGHTHVGPCGEFDVVVVEGCAHGLLDQTEVTGFDHLIPYCYLVAGRDQELFSCAKGPLADHVGVRGGSRANAHHLDALYGNGLTGLCEYEIAFV